MYSETAPVGGGAGADKRGWLILLRRLHRSYTEIQPVTPDDLIHAAPAIAKGVVAIGAAYRSPRS
jgi:hypothetical protein